MDLTTPDDKDTKRKLPRVNDSKPVPLTAAPESEEPCLKLPGAAPKNLKSMLEPSVPDLEEAFAEQKMSVSLSNEDVADIDEAMLEDDDAQGESAESTNADGSPESNPL